MKRRIAGLSGLVAVVLALSGCAATGVGQMATESAAVRLVRTGTLELCPSSTLGEMADAFLANPQWDDFVADDGSTVVELTGGMTYDGSPVDALLQFDVDESAGTFETAYVEIDGQGQTTLVASVLLGKMCDAV